MVEFFAFMGAVVRAYADHHEQDILDPELHVYSDDGSGKPYRDETVAFFNFILSGWWLVDDTGGWDWWLCVFTRSPAQHIADGGDLINFPYCLLDAPLPDADFTEFGLRSRNGTLAGDVATG